jgi:RsiW-degrading membrane proteinase PrsW (M82 family)
MLSQMVEFFLSAFRFPGLSWIAILIAIVLGLFIGAIWLAAFWPPFRKAPGILLVGMASAFLTWAAIAFMQIPLQTWAGQVLTFFWNQVTLLKWMLLAAIPQIFISGLVQEGAKLVPVIVYRWFAKHVPSPIHGLLAGALSGAGFGIFESIWVFNSLFAAGWTWQAVQLHGIYALLGFWERFFSVGFHISASAIAGFGLAKGRGLRFYLLASLLHGLVNYSLVLANKGILSALETEIYIAAISVLTALIALLIRWHKEKSPFIAPVTM